MRKWFLIFSPFLFLLALVAGLRIFLQPQIESWVLSQVQEFSQNQLPVVIEAKKFELIWFTPKVRLIETEVTPKPGEKLGFKTARLKTLEARLDMIQALAGRIHLSLVILDSPEVDVDLDTIPQSNTKLEVIDWAKIFKALRNVPVSRLALVDGKVNVKSAKDSLFIGINALQGRLELDNDRVDVDVQTSSLDLKVKDFPSKQQNLRLGIRLDASITPKNINLNQLNLSNEGQTLLAKGVFTDIRKIPSEPKGQLSLKLSSNLQVLSSQLKDFLPKMKGLIEIDSNLKLNGLKVPEGDFELSGQDVRIENSEVGTFKAQGRSVAGQITIPKVSVRHVGGEAEVSNLVLKIPEDTPELTIALDSDVKVVRLNLHELLKGIDVGDIPVQLQAKGDLSCGGLLAPKFNLICTGTAQGSDLVVKSDSRDIEPIVAVSEFQLNGGVEIDTKAVTYTSKIKAGQDQGQSSGVIKYDQGFIISYNTPSVDLGLIKKVAGLRLEGRAKIQGTTQGDSNAATLEMKAVGENFIFEDFNLGAPATSIVYEKGALYLPDLVGTVGLSNYQGQIEAHLTNPGLKAKVSSSKVDWTDLNQIFDRIFKMPFPVQGQGSFEIALDGPYELGKLSYILDAKVDRLLIYDESFTEGLIRLNSQAGEVQSEVFQIKKGSQLITAQGQGHPDGQVEAVITTEQLLLEESEFVRKIDTSMSGKMQALVDVKGFILDPEVRLQLQLSQFVIDNQEFPPSSADVTLNRDRAFGNFSLFAGHLNSDFQIPFKDKMPFKIKAKAIDWNFTTMAAFVGGGPLLSEYEASLTGDFEIASDQGGFWASSGEGNIQRFLLKRGNQALRNPKPMGFSMKSGVISLQNFRIEGDNSYYSLQGNRIAKDNLRFQVNGDGSLRLFHVFVPFLEELGGQAVLDIAFSGDQQQLEILGQATLRDGFAKLKDFPHPLERFSSQIQFSQTKILLNDIRGGFAGGTVTGDGSVILNGSKNIETNIRAKIEGVSLNVPDKVRTTGNLDLRFTGSWFPFVLSGNYNVTSGLFEKELEDAGSMGRIKQSSYLPKQIKETTFEPVLLDLDVDLSRPIVIKNSMVDGQATGKIQVRGSPTQPGLFGNIVLVGGSKLLFADKIFDVNNASLKFTDETQINPELYVSARSRIDTYDVNLLVQGTALSPIVKLTSLPPLPEPEIISLLALGVTSSSTAVNSTSGANSNALEGQAAGAALNQVVNMTGLGKQETFNVGVTSDYDDTKNQSVHKLTLKVKVSEKAEASATTKVGTEGVDAKIKYFLTPNFSAVGSWESKSSTEANAIKNQQESSSGVFGLDLDYTKEFK